MPLLLRIYRGGNVVGCLFVMVKLCVSLAGRAAGCGVLPFFARQIIFLFFSFFFLFFSLSWHSSKNRCGGLGWYSHLGIFTISCSSLPTHTHKHTHTHTHTHTLRYSTFTQTAPLCRQPTRHKQMWNIPFHMFFREVFNASLLLQSVVRQPKKKKKKEGVGFSLDSGWNINTLRIHTSVAEEEAVINQCLAGVNDTPNLHTQTYTQHEHTHSFTPPSVSVMHLTTLMNEEKAAQIRRPHVPATSSCGGGGGSRANGATTLRLHHHIAMRPRHSRVHCCDCNQASPDNYHNQLITGLGDQTRLLQRQRQQRCVFWHVSVCTCQSRWAKCKQLQRGGKKNPER